MICTALISHLTVLIFLHLVASCYEQWDKLPLEGPLGTRADFSWRQKFLNSWGTSCGPWQTLLLFTWLRVTVWTIHINRTLLHNYIFHKFLAPYWKFPWTYHWQVLVTGKHQCLNSNCFIHLQNFASNS